MVTNEDIGGQTGGHVIKPLKIKKNRISTIEWYSSIKLLPMLLS